MNAEMILEEAEQKQYDSCIDKFGPDSELNKADRFLKATKLFMSLSYSNQELILEAMKITFDRQQALQF
jgi:hypothetical protein